MSFFKRFVNHDIDGSFVNRMRKKRFSYLQSRIENKILEKGSLKILDIGGEYAYWQHLGWKNENCTIYLLNLNLPPETKDIPGFRFIAGTAINLPYQAGDFDLIYSNSVIEHVGSKQNQEKFSEEVHRVCDKYIVQTPSLWFPLEPHSLIPLFQFIPHALRAFLIMWFNINYFPKAKTYQEALQVSKSTLMLTKKEFRKLFPDAEIYVEKLYGIPKSYTAIKL